MGKLYKAFMGIDAARKHCIQNLRQGGVIINGDATLDEVATKILEGPNPSPYGELWTRPQEWIDTENILDNAPVHEGYKAYAIVLLDDETDELSLDFINSYCLDGYYLSDGTWLAQDTSSKVTQTHTWDKSKDIATTLPYKQRYVIQYAKVDVPRSITALNSNSYNWKLYTNALELVTASVTASDLNITNTNILNYYIPKTGSSTLSYKLKRIVINLINFQLHFYQLREHDLKELIINEDVTIEDYISTFYSLSHLLINKNVTFSTDIIPNAVLIEMPDVVTIINRNSGELTVTADYFDAPNLEQAPLRLLELVNINAPKLTSEITLTDIKSRALYLPELTALNTYSADMGKGNLRQYKLCCPKLTNLVGYINGASVIQFDVLTTINADNNLNNSYLRELTLGTGFNHSLNLSSCQYLSKVSILDLFNKVATVTEGQYIQLHTNVKNNLTEDELAIATNKGWVIK